MREISDILPCELRKGSGKGGARKLRALGMVPGIVYGPGMEPLQLSVNAREFVDSRKRYGRAHMYKLQVSGGDTLSVYIRDVQQHAVSNRPWHIDFYRVDMSRPMKVSVRIDLVGKAAGVVEGGVLSHMLHRVELKGLPGVIPDSIELDVSGLKIGDLLHISDLKLPEGVVATSQHDEAIVSVHEAAAAPAAEPAEGEAAAEADKPA